MLDNEWLNNPSLAKMDPRKKTILKNIMRQAKGKNMNQSIPLIMQAQNQLSAQGLSFTPEEQTVLIAILTADFTPQDKKQFENIQKMMGGRKK